MLAVAKREPADDDQPVVWTHTYGAGRVVGLVFGHDAASLAHPLNSRIVTQALSWVLEDV